MSVSSPRLVHYQMVWVSIHKLLRMRTQDTAYSYQILLKMLTANGRGHAEASVRLRKVESHAGPKLWHKRGWGWNGRPLRGAARGPGGMGKRKGWRVVDV